MARKNSSSAARASSTVVMPPEAHACRLRVLRRQRKIDVGGGQGHGPRLKEPLRLAHGVGHPRRRDVLTVTETCKLRGIDRPAYLLAAALRSEANREDVFTPMTMMWKVEREAGSRPPDG